MEGREGGVGVIRKHVQNSQTTNKDGSKDQEELKLRYTNTVSASPLAEHRGLLDLRAFGQS